MAAAIPVDSVASRFRSRRASWRSPTPTTCSFPTGRTARPSTTSAPFAFFVRNPGRISGSRLSALSCAASASVSTARQPPDQRKSSTPTTPPAITSSGAASGARSKTTNETSAMLMVIGSTSAARPSWSATAAIRPRAATLTPSRKPPAQRLLRTIATIRSRNGTRTKPGRKMPSVASNAPPNRATRKPAEVEQRPDDDAGDDRPDPIQHPADEHGGRELPVEPGEPEHDRHCRADEDTAGDHQPGNAGALVAEQDGELGRGRTRDQLAGGEVFEEDALIEPAPSIDHLAAHQGDVRDRPAEGDQTQLGEDACDFTEGPAQVAIDARRFPFRSGGGQGGG